MHAGRNLRYISNDCYPPMHVHKICKFIRYEMYGIVARLILTSQGHDGCQLQLPTVTLLATFAFDTSGTHPLKISVFGADMKNERPKKEVVASKNLEVTRRGGRKCVQ
jgi:hypothetical protein